MNDGARKAGKAADSTERSVPGNAAGRDAKDGVRLRARPPFRLGRWSDKEWHRVIQNGAEMARCGPKWFSFRVFGADMGRVLAISIFFR